VEEATSALRKALPDLDRHMAEGSIEVVGHDEWFIEGRAFDLHRVVNRFKEKVDEATARGYAGMRVNGSPAWMRKEDGKELLEFEGEVDRLFPNERIIASCTYPLAGSGAADLLDVTRTHQFAIARRHSNWELIETPELKQAKAEIKRLNEGLEQRVVERTRELAVANEKLRTEIAERNQIEEALRESESRLRLALDAARMGCFDWDMVSGKIIWSSVHANLFGLDPNSFRGTYQEFDERVHPEDREALNAMVARARDERTFYSHEYRIIWPDGTVHWVAGQGQFFYDPTGKPVRMSGLVLDITERKWAEENLRKSEAQLAEAQQLAQLGSWSRELATNVVTWSDEIFRIFGMDHRKLAQPTRRSWNKYTPTTVQPCERLSRMLSSTIGLLAANIASPGSMEPCGSSMNVALWSRMMPENLSVSSARRRILPNVNMRRRNCGRRVSGCVPWRHTCNRCGRRKGAG